MGDKDDFDRMYASRIPMTRAGQRRRIRRSLAGGCCMVPATITLLSMVLSIAFILTLSGCGNSSVVGSSTTISKESAENSISSSENDSSNSSLDAEKDSRPSLGYSSRALMQQTGDGSLAEGIYKVGEDIPAGEYQMQADGLGYFEILSDQSGKDSSVLVDCQFGYSAYVNVKAGQYLRIERCNLYSSSQEKPISHDTSKIDPGIYKVGFDFPAGQYTIEAEGDKVHATTLTDISSSGLEKTLSAAQQFIGFKTFDAKDGQYLFFDGGTLQAK